MKLVRDAKQVLSQIETNKGGQVITKVPCRVQVPSRWMDVELGGIGSSNYAYGLFPVILENNVYSVINVCSYVEMDPYKVTTTMIDDTEYYEFGFESGSVLFKTNKLVNRDELIYNILNELIFKGKVPWYCSYDDIGKLFDTAKKHAGSNVGQNLEVMEFIASMVTRYKNDRRVLIRNVAKNYKDTEIDSIAFVPLKSVLYSVNSTVNKLAGSYFSEGVVSALVNPSEKAEKIEKILRA